MPEELRKEITDMDDTVTLPRLNGDLSFESPWEARAFGLAVALNKSGAFPWQHFSRGLAAEIQQTESAGKDSSYFEQWLKTLETLLIENGLVSAISLKAQVREQARHDNHDH